MKALHLSSKHLWLIVFGVWTLIAIFHYVQFYFQYLNEGTMFLWLPTLVEFIVNYYSWVGIAVATVWLGRKFRFQTRWPRALLVHCLACVGFALLHVAIVATMLKLFKAAEFELRAWSDFYLFVFLQLFHFECLIYWAVLGLSYGFQHYAHSRPGRDGTSFGNYADASPYLDKILIKNNGSSVLLDTARVDWLEAADNYVNIHAGDHSYLLREKMHVLETKLDPRCFRRIHRSTIVNLGRVKELSRGDAGDYSVILGSGQQLSVSRRRRDQVHEFFTQLA